MGLFDKIKDNAKTISIKAIEDAQRDGGRAPQVNSSYTESNQDNVYRPSYDEVTEQINVRMTDKPVVSPQTYGVTPEGMYDNNDPSDSTPYIERLGNIDMPQKVGQPDFMSNNDLPYDQELSYDESASYQTEDYLDGKSEPRAVDKPDSGKSEQSKVVAAKSSIPQNSATNSQPTPPSDANQSKNDETIIKPNSESSAKSAISTKQAAPTSSQDSQTSSQDDPPSTNSSPSSAGRNTTSSSSALRSFRS